MYSRLTNGASEKISRTFIRNQYLVLPITRITDRIAIKYQKRGIPIVDIDMVSMELIDDFREGSTQDPLPLSAFDPIDVRPIKRRIKLAYEDGSFPAVSQTIEAELKTIEDLTTYHAMFRHMLESMLRAANLAEVYLELARQKQYKSTRGLSRWLLRLHLNALSGCAKLDKLSAPIQADGIPIIKQDVPPIDPRPKEIEAYLKNPWSRDYETTPIFILSR